MYTIAFLQGGIFASKRVFPGVITRSGLFFGMAHRATWKSFGKAVHIRTSAAVVAAL
jgi:hypothetical protein